MQATPTSNSLARLTVGAVVGSIRDLFAKIAAIDAKHGKFDFVLCVGDLFGSLEDSDAQDEINQLLDGKIVAPAECYVMQGENPLPDSVIQRFAKTGGELCKNVFLMSVCHLVCYFALYTAVSQVRITDHYPWTPNRLSGWNLRQKSI